MTKVFHIISHFDLGGAERIAINIAKSKNTEIEYHLVEVVNTNSAFRSAIIEELKDNGIKYHCSPVSKNKIAILLFPFWFIYIFFKHKPEIIHSHTEVPDLSIWLFNKIISIFSLKIKFVRTIHNTQLWNDWDKIGKKVEPFFIKKKSNVTISKATQESYRIKYKEIAPIIYNGVEVITKKKFENLVYGKKNILFAGRFEFQKGIKQLIAVINGLKESDIYFFHIVGSGSLKEEIINSLDNVNVSIYEPIHNLAIYLSSFDYLFMPSNFEGLPLLSIESSFNKTPVIVNTCLGLDETLPENWVLRVKNNSIEQYIHIFNEILPNIDYEKLTDEAYNFVNSNFSIEKMQQNYELKYFELLKE
jgi:glycosyltransferase involved in cell wall biosynthesis